MSQGEGCTGGSQHSNQQVAAVQMPREIPASMSGNYPFLWGTSWVLLMRNSIIAIIMPDGKGILQLTDCLAVSGHDPNLI